MNKEKRIVFLGFLVGYGGAEKSMIMLANGLSKYGHSITVISFKDNRVVYELEDSVQYIYIDDNKKNYNFNKILRFKKLKNALINLNPDIVISFWLQPAIYSTLLSKKLGFKTIYSERGDPSDKEYNGVLGILRKIFLRKIDGFVFQTNGAKEYFPESIQRKSIVISNPIYIDPRDYPTPKSRRKIIVSVGRLHDQKNHKLLINAFNKISSEFPEYKLEIYGEGDLKTDLEMQIIKLGLNGNVFLKGTYKDLLNRIIDSSLFVLTSDYEGMPNALLEAMSLGIPSISTDCKPGAARELIENGITGIIVKRGNLKELIDAISFMLNNPTIANEMGNNSRKKILQNHSIDVIFNLWNNYIDRVMVGKNE